MTFFLRNVNDVRCPRDGLMSVDWFNKFWRSKVKIEPLRQRWSACKREELAFSKTVDFLPVRNSTILNSDEHGYG